MLLLQRIHSQIQGMDILSKYEYNKLTLYLLLLTMNCKGYNVKQPTRLQVAKFLLDFHVNLKNYMKILLSKDYPYVSNDMNKGGTAFKRPFCKDVFLC